MVELLMQDFRDRQTWKEARLITAVLHQVSDSLPPAWSVRLRQRAVGLLVALTNPDHQPSAEEAVRLCDKLLMDFRAAYYEDLIDTQLYKKLNEEAILLSKLLKQHT